jgi:hypothetical protein
MHRVVMHLDLADPAARIDGDQVAAVHVVQIRGSQSVCAIIAMARQQAALLPIGRLGLGDADGLKAMEGFRRWLKLQGVDLKKIDLRTMSQDDYRSLSVDGGFIPATLAPAGDASVTACFADWLASRALTPLGARTV